MAAPFEQRPTLQEYLDWAKKAGCEWGEAPHADEVLFRINAPNGRFVFFMAEGVDERLTPSQVSNLDRRLGMDSPFSGRPEF